MKPVLRILTVSGRYYDILPNGDILRLDMPGFTASGQWKMIGLVPCNRSGLIPLSALLNGGWIKNLPALTYKNGNPVYTVRDFDHGTVRQWGDGVRAIWPTTDTGRMIVL
jgi:hypothetical protein